jgi:hypothetical protein
MDERVNTFFFGLFLLPKRNGREDCLFVVKREMIS